MGKCAAGSRDGQMTASIFSEAVPQTTCADIAHYMVARSTQLARPMHLILPSATSNPQANRGSVPGRTANLPPRFRYPQYAGRCRTNSEGHNDLPPRSRPRERFPPSPEHFRQHVRSPVRDDIPPKPPPSPKAAARLFVDGRGAADKRRKTQIKTEDKDRLAAKKHKTHKRRQKTKTQE